MNFPIMHVKSIKADYAKHELDITFSCALDEDAKAEAEELSQYTGKDGGTMDITIVPAQLPLFDTAREE